MVTKKFVMLSIICFLMLSSIASAATNTSGNNTKPSVTGGIVETGKRAWEVTAQVKDLGANWLDKTLLAGFTAGQIIMWIVILILACVVLLVIFKFWPIILIIFILIVAVIIIAAIGGGIALF